MSSSISSVEKAWQTQLANIQAKTGKTLDELSAHLRQSGLQKHSEVRDLFKRDLGLGYGDANALALFLLKAGQEPASPADAVAELYSGPKAGLRPIHDKLMEAARGFGEFETAPKKGYLSLRRKKQFAMLGPATTSRVELGLNAKGLPAHPRLLEQPAGGMCTHKVRLTAAEEVDAELIGWLRLAYNAQG